LQNALLINPYDVDQMAKAIYCALEMDPREVRARMAGLRRSVKEANVYRWAANLLSELAQIGPERAQVATSAKGS
jgi:trehalose 6-phosphate synthase